MEIYPNLIARIVKWANRYVELAQQTPDFPQEKNSGYCVIKSRDYRTLLVFQVGDVPSEKVEKYLSLANEKADRLIAHIAKGHWSSWQSRDGINKWGGAVLVPDFVLSFSGLPEMADEAIMLLTARACYMLLPTSACTIADISDNKLFFAIDAVPQVK